MHYYAKLNSAALMIAHLYHSNLINQSPDLQKITAVLKGIFKIIV